MPDITHMLLDGDCGIIFSNTFASHAFILVRSHAGNSTI